MDIWVVYTFWLFWIKLQFVHIYLCEHIFVSSLKYIPRSRTAESDNSYFNFLRNYHRHYSHFHRSCIIFIFLLAMPRVQFLHIFTNNYCSFKNILEDPMGCEVVTHITVLILSIFTVLIGHLNIFFGEMCNQILCLLFIYMCLYTHIYMYIYVCVYVHQTSSPKSFAHFICACMYIYLIYMHICAYYVPVCAC